MNNYAFFNIKQHGKAYSLWVDARAKTRISLQEIFGIQNVSNFF